MQKYTERNVRRKAVMLWQPDMQKLIVYPQAWGFFCVDSWHIRASQPFWILYWNPLPGAVITCDGTEFEPDPGTIYLFPPHTFFQGNNYKPFVQFAVHFFAEAPFDRVLNKMLTFSADGISELIMELSSKNSKLQNMILLQQIILNALSQIPMTAFSPKEKTLLDPRIKEILQFIRKNPGGRYTVEELCAKVKMSVNNFHRRFVAGTDMTPKQYLLKSRMVYAKTLLLETEMTIDDVATAAGFLDRYHFSKVFKNYFIHPPATFRKKILRTPKTEGE